MIVKNIKLRLVKTEKREGLTTDKKPYLFYVVKVIDEDANVIQLKLNNKLEEDVELVKKLIVAKNVDINCDLGIYPSGFNLKGIVQKIDL